MKLYLVKVLLVMIVGLCVGADRFDCDRQSVSCGCGLNNVAINARPGQGENTVPYSWPMVVSIRYDCRRDGAAPSHCCVGTILSESYVLTSAACAEGIDPSMLRAGGVSVAASAAPGRSDRASRTVDQVIIHVNRTRVSDGFLNDVAVLRLAQPLDFAKDLLFARTCRPAQSDVEKYPASDALLAVVGWGRQAAVHSVNRDDSTCAGRISDAQLQFCAGQRTDGSDACTSDSGSPVFRWIGDRWEQVGLATRGMAGCPSEGYQHVFTRLDAYHNWINSITSLSSPKATLLSRRPPPIYRCNRRALSCGCGINQVEMISSRILGGDVAISGSWAMAASLRFNGSGQHGCGGSILADHYFLTAANCVDKLSATSPVGLTVRVAAHDLSEGAQEIYEVDRIFVHPKWVGAADGYQNDIALLHVTESLDIDTNPFTKRTCVPQLTSTTNVQQYPPNGTRLAVVGWGIMQSGEMNTSMQLRQAEVFAVDNNDPKCQAVIKDKQTQFCAGLPNGGKDTCRGDSGGPIFEWKGKFWEQVGITSYRGGCGNGNQPSVYTRLVTYFDWMESVINGSLTTTTKTPPITNPPVTYTCDKSVPCGCGYNDVMLPPTRIVGGYDAIPYSWSMVVSLRRVSTDRHNCGGSIISDSFILTAAHCVMNRNKTAPTDVLVVAGMHQQSESSQVQREVDRIYMHPEWVPGQLGNWNDIALLHLAQPLNLSSNPYLKRSCLPRLNSSVNMLTYPANGTRLAVIGWGLIDEENTFIPEELQQTEFFVQDKQGFVCNKDIRDKARQFCAGVDGGGKGTCRGDSGGPVLEWKGNRWEQVGLTSYAKDCASDAYASVFTQVANYVEWIEKVTNESMAITTKPPPTIGPTSSGRREGFQVLLLAMWGLMATAAV